MRTGAKARAIPEATTGSRILRWDGCRNVRDLGGLPLEQGGETAFRVAVRADSIRRLTDDGWRSLADYGVRLAVDLRGENECVDDPPRALPIRLAHLPIDAREVEAVATWPSMADAYRALLGHFSTQLAAAVRAVGEADGAVVIHCFGGRDRTGLVSAFLLRLAGVGLETIAADHALSDALFGPTLERWVGEAADDAERARRRRVVVPAGQTMAELLAELERAHGGIEPYLHAAGTPAPAIERVRRRLTGED